jgi:zinc/manganese transport system substrate-binding protein
MSMRFDASRRASLQMLLAMGALRPALAATSAEPAAAPVLKVVATFSILADMVREVGGPAVEVSALVGPNADAHVYEPTPADVRRVARADLVVANGLRFEGWIDRLIASSGYRGKVVVASAGIVPLQLGGGADPHAWQSMVNGQRYAQTLRDALLAAAPQRSAEINAQAAGYLARMAALEQDTRSRIAALPESRRRVITSHDAFGYFAAAYGVRFIAPRGWTTGSEPSAETVARIVRQARETQASALLVENISDPRLIERIAREAHLKVGGQLYSDALSAPGTAADTYIHLFEHNVRTLVEAMTPAGNEHTH